VTPRPFTLGVLVSGAGSNLGAILDAILAGGLAARVAVVVSNEPRAKALEVAARARLPAVVVDHRCFSDRPAFDAAVRDVLLGHGVDCCVFAGFMRVVTPVLLDAFPDRVLNLHPSLLPAFPGRFAVRQALAHGVTVTGCTVHLVNEQLDDGAIVAQESVPVLEGDDELSLAARIRLKEHELLPRVLSWMAQGRVLVERPANARARVRILEGRT
jgi:phosphoribosylglycinamide formyltransferase-1